METRERAREKNAATPFILSPTKAQTCALGTCPVRRKASTLMVMVGVGRVLTHARADACNPPKPAFNIPRALIGSGAPVVPHFHPCAKAHVCALARKPSNMATIACWRLEA